MDRSPSLAKRITGLRKSLKLNQTELAEQLGISPMAVSRWERNVGQPGAACLIKLGRLAEDNADACWDFWNLAGLSLRDVIKVLPMAEKRFRRTLPIVQMVNAGAETATLQKPNRESLVAIPFLPVFVAAGKEKGSSDHDLTRAQSEQILVAPKMWCPHPDQTVSMRVRGSSMEPTLFDGYIIVVDQRQIDKKELHGAMIVAHHGKFGLVVSRFWRMKGSDVLVSENRSHDPTLFTSAWRTVGKVLWWIGESSPQQE